MKQLTTHALRLPLFVWLTTTLLVSCDSYKESLSTPTPPSPIFYGTDFIGHFESDSVFSNGANVSGIVKIVLDLQPGTGTLSYMESNPVTGTVYTELLNAEGGWNMNASHDSIFLKVYIGSHQEVINVEYGSGESSYTYSETITVKDYQELTIPFRRVAPGKYILQREFKGANQQYYLTKW